MRIALVVPGGVDRSEEFRIAAKHHAAPFDVIHAIWSGTCGLIAALAGKPLGIPSLIHIAGGELVSIPQIGYGGFQNWRGRVRETRVLRAVSAITAASTPTIDRRQALGLEARRVPLGVDLKRWPPRQPVRRNVDQRPKLIHVASLNRVKDQSTLLRALAALQHAGMDFEMQILGEDTLHGAIHRLSRDLGVAQRIHFHGFLTQRQMRPLVEAADLMILTSRHETGAIARLLEDDDLRFRIALAALARATQEDADFTARRFQNLYRSVA